MKVDASIYGSHKPYCEDHRVSCLRENLTSSSEGEGLETGLEGTAPVLYPPKYFMIFSFYPFFICRRLPTNGKDAFLCILCASVVKIFSKIDSIQLIFFQKKDENKRI